MNARSTTGCAARLVIVVAMLMTSGAASPLAFAQQRSSATSPGADFTLWIRDTGQWSRYSGVPRLKLEPSVTLEMNVGETKSLLPIVTGGPGHALYVDLCVPVDEFYVPDVYLWPAVDPEQWDCARYSGYVAAGDPRSERSPAEPLQFRALKAGTYTFRYRIMTAEWPQQVGEFRVVVR